LKDDRLALFSLGDLDLGRSQRREILLAHRLTERILDEELDRLVQDGGGAENALDDRSGGLARTKARDAVLLRKAPSSRVDRARQAFGRQLELDLEAGLGQGGVGRLHRGRL